MFLAKIAGRRLTRSGAYIGAGVFVVTLATACGDGETDGIPTGPVTSAGDTSSATGTGGAGTGAGGGLPFDGVSERAVIYQLVPRLFSNVVEMRKPHGTLAENGVGRFADVNDAAIASIKDLGATHVWLTGAIRQATMTDYASIGLPADDADIVKGRAGSFYAIRDYYDVSPDYAVDPATRMTDFEALVGRIHGAGMRVLVDFVPNHVARSYASVVRPDADFGKGDDTTRFFSPQSSFFYLVDPPGQQLILARPAGYAPPGAVFDGAFAGEDGSAGKPPKATGNNVTSPAPSATDWYETIKLNWGFDFAGGTRAFDPTPATWEKADAILAYWQEKGVDGFRCDFAHFVPNEAWSYLIGRARMRNPAAYFIAEAYENLEGLIGAGFDAVYFDGGYDAMKRMYIGEAGQGDLDATLGGLDDGVRGRYAMYLENHDERRIASPIVPGSGPDSSGFGSPRAGQQLGPISYLFSNGPILFYNGQETGEPAAGAEGFGGDDGRTTIFDYWSMPTFAGYVNGGAYDGGGLPAERVALRAYYRDLLALVQAPAARGNRFWGLEYFNATSMFPDANDDLFTFARFAQGSGRLIVVAANFGVGKASTGMIRLPDDLLERAGIRATGPVEIVKVLDEQGKKEEPSGTSTRTDLTSAGFSVTVSDQAASVFEIR